MTYFPGLHKRWMNPHWQPKFFGGKRLPRKLKKAFGHNDFYWMRPTAWPSRWLSGTYPASGDSDFCLVNTFLVAKDE